ncbi:MAG: type II secretion system protein GspG [Phycisphaeraceae bacterium]|nr:type II secretion system protein GspG [Phycisphaeraceae bacterium]
MTHRMMFAAAMIGTVCNAAMGGVFPSDPPAAPDQKERWIRVTEDSASGRVKLQVAARSYTRPGAGDGRVVWLASAVHVGDRSYYRALQQSLDAKDVVLYEGVKPPGAGRTEHDLGEGSDEQRAEATRKRLRFLGLAVKMHERATGRLPESLGDLTRPTDKGVMPDERIAPFVAASLVDAWGNAIEYTLLSGEGGVSGGAGGFDLVSLGADGQAGGEGAAADLLLSQQKSITADEIPNKSEGGIQQQLAGALGLVFQLDAMDHSKPNWRNSDLSMDQVSERIAGSGGDADDLFASLGGASAGARFAGALLKFIGASPMLSGIAKVMMVEMLGQADELLEVVPGGMGKLMDVIIKDRNEVVINDLVGVLEHEPDKKNIGIIYGAGHMPDLEERMAVLGFTENSVVWLTAIDVDLDRTGLPRSQINSMRAMLRDTVKEQARAMRRAEERRRR